MKDTRTLPTEEVTLSEKKIEEKLTSLLKHRKGQINHLQTCLNPSNKNSKFMKTINLVQKYEEVNESFHKKSNKMLILKSYYLLGSFLSSTLDLPNCNEKLQVVQKIFLDFELFLDQLSEMEEKFLISSLPQLALIPPSLKIKIEVVDALQEKKEPNSGSKFQSATSKFMNFIEKSLNVASKKVVRINEKRYNLTDKKIFLDYFKHSFKVSQLTEKISFFTVVSSLCEILDIILTAFMDEVYFTRESYETLKKVDELIQENVVKIVYRDLLRVSWVQIDQEIKSFAKSALMKDPAIPSLQELAEQLSNK